MTKQKALAKQAKTHKTDSFTFSDHIRELRRRVVWVGLVFLVASSVAYSYHDQLVSLVMSPLKGGKLIYLTPGGGFSFIFQISLYAGIIAAAPTAMYQLYKFIRPTLPSNVQYNAVKVAFFATLLMILGVGYGYFIAVPAALQFLSTFAGDNVIPNLTADSYLTFFLSYVGGLALLFQLPLLLIFWHWVKPLSPTGLLKSERLIIVFAFIVAALITPTPDVVNQTMIAGPLIALYQIGAFVVLASILHSRRTKKHKQTSPSLPLSSTPLTQATSAAPTPHNPFQALQPAPHAPLPPVSPSRPKSTVRSPDGFLRVPPAASSTALQPQVRRLAVPTRPPLPARPGTNLSHRPKLSIDGISPA